MAPYAYDENGRRVAAPSKGELREKAILDQAEAQLVDLGADSMTVESIANAAGLTRGALYFYFRSKNDVLAALVQRVTVELAGAVSTRERVAAGEPRAALLSAIDLTRDLWARHGAVMRAAVELSPTVSGIESLWSAAREQIVASVTTIAAGMGVPDGEGPEDAPALVTALVSMTERCFYEAFVTGRDLDHSAATVAAVWLRALRPGGPSGVD